MYTIGHFRGRGIREIFPIKGRYGKNSPSINQIVGIEVVGVVGDSERRQRDRGRIIGINGCSPALTGTMYKEVYKVSIPLGVIDRQGRKDKKVKPHSVCPTLRAQTHGNLPEIVIPVITPDRVNKRQNGRGFKDVGDESFSLTGQDRHGVAIGVDVQCDLDGSHPPIDVRLNNGSVVSAVWYEKHQCYIVIRKLTPKECFRLQGWSDEYFERAELVNSNSQLYKQAGNGITVNVMYDIAKRL